MSAAQGPEVWLVRHGETEWSRSGQHTSTTELELTEHGVEVARTLEERLAGEEFSLVLTSPRVRARKTAELAGFGGAEVDDDLAEWAYGEYEGITTAEIRGDPATHRATARPTRYAAWRRRSLGVLPTGSWVAHRW